MQPRPDWLAQVQEEILEPDLPIVDPHHHFWVESGFGRYLLDDLWADTGAGHRVERTVFLECRAEYLREGPRALRPVGETRFVAGLAAQTAAGPEGAARGGGGGGGHRRPRRPAAGRRRRGGPPRPPGGQPPLPRHPPRGELGSGAEPLGAGRRPLPGSRLPRGFRQARPAGAELRRLDLPLPDPGPGGSRPRLPRDHHRPRPSRRPPGDRPLRGPPPGGLRGLARPHGEPEPLSQRERQGRRHRHAAQRLRLARARPAAGLGGAGRGPTGPGACRPSTPSARSAACSRATSPWTRSRSPTRCSGTPSSASPPDSPPPTRTPSSGGRPRGLYRLD